MVGLRFVIGDCVLDAERFVFERSGEPVQVQPQVFDVLAYLLEHRDRVVPKEELLDSIWGDRFVSESALLSDHDPGEITFESFVADLETLVDSLGL